jgi:eukaryotic-like serine/threonine-protein kinase
VTPERWQRVKELLAPALELEPAKRTPYLDQVCVDDPSLRPDLERLLAAEERAGADFLGKPATPQALTESISVYGEPWIGRRVGPYQIVEEIGAGGMGAVYRAIRSDGQYEQQVALKIVRADLGSLTAERFRAERQILASLDHPNIARILDGGATADGLPYLVMELIDGILITGYCDQHKLSINDRLKMFRVVCSAVHYAHQHLIIHRDIKPSNILVTAEAIPKLLDFGIAKILDPNLLPENISLTAAGLWMMTPEYASPEQFRGQTITTASDVYSLGLVLYELLAGHPAYRFTSHMPHEIAHVVLNTDPERPSTAIRRAEAAAEDHCQGGRLTPKLVSGLRGDSAEKLQRRLAGDLDNIVLKALRKQPGERYTSADQLSEDIRRHLDGLPVLARKSTVAYRCRKYISRHKIGVTASVLIFISLLTSIALTLREARIAHANELRAERRFNDVRKLANSLIFEVHDSIRELPGATAARKLIVQRAQEYLDSLAAESTSDVSLLRELAAAYTRLGSVLGNSNDANLGNSDQALRDYRRAAELREAVSVASPSDPDSRRELAESYMGVGFALGQMGERNGSQEWVSKALSILKPLAAANPDNRKIRYALAKAFERDGQNFAASAKWAEAKTSYEESLALYRHLSEVDPKEALYMTEVAYAHKHLGAVLIMEKQLQPALEQYRAARAIDEAQIKADPGNANKRFAITYGYSDIGFILGKQGDIEGALSYYGKAFDIRSELAAADPRDTRARQSLANTYNYIARLLWLKGDLNRALEDHTHALELRQALSQSDPSNEFKRLNVAFSLAGVGETYVKMAFQPHTTAQRQLALCEQAESWLQRALPEIQKRKNLLGGEDAEYPAVVQQAIDRCNTVLLRRDRQN